jgi:integrase
MPDMGCPRTSPCGRSGCCAARAPCPKTPSSGARQAGAHRTRLEKDRGTVRAPSLRSVVRASSRPGERKSEPAVTRDVLDWLIATCATDRLADTRDLAILLLAFSSGGRRRSEVVRLRVEQLRDAPPARLDPRDGKSPTLPCLGIRLGRTKTGDAHEEGRVFWSTLRSRPCAN